MFVDRIHSYSYSDDLGRAQVIDDLDEHIVQEPNVRPSIMRVCDPLKWDHCEEFVQLIRHEFTVGPLRKAGYVIAPSALLNCTISERALRCAESLLSGAAGVLVNVNVPPNIYEMSPFYMALSELLPDFVNLFLNHGAWLDVRCDARYSAYHMLLPMDVAFQSLRGMIWWTPSQSVYELIFTLGSSVEKKVLSTICYLLRALPVQLSQKAICLYAREGKIVELTILLYVDAIFELGIFKGLKDEYFALRESVVTNVTMVGKQVMKSVLLSLKIFYRTNFSMLGFENVRAVLEKRMNNAGFHLTNLQNLDDVHENHVEATEDAKVIKPMVDLPRCVFGTRALKPTSMEIGQFRTVFTRNLYTPIVVRSQVKAGPQLLSCSLRGTWPVLASAFRRIVGV